MPDVYICEIVDSEKLGAATWSLTVLSPDLAKTALPGQFLHIKCGDGLLLRRPFGICSVFGGALVFVFEVKGKGTRWLSGREPGDMLDILGPLGNGFSFPEGDIIVAGGGLGAPPLLFAAESAKRNVTAVLGFRDMSKVILRDEFENACDAVYLATDDGSMGIHGQVTVPLEELLKKGGYEAVLSCGQHAMQKNVAKICARYGVPCQVSLEERMGCGVGACLACACATRGGGGEQMRLVCKDGPVFDAAQVVWQA